MSQMMLKNAACKSTKKRRLLLSILQTQNKPITAEELLEQSAAILPMNLSTIYRTLNTFTENGILHKTLRKDGKAYFTLAKHDHTHHLVGRRFTAKNRFSYHRAFIGIFWHLCRLFTKKQCQQKRNTCINYFPKYVKNLYNSMQWSKAHNKKYKKAESA